MRRSATLDGRARALGRLVLAATVALLAARSADARPTYFDAFRTLYGINDGDNLDACGVCHFLWTGTGARNPFGNAVEQQLYVGKSITQALTDIEPDDPDGDTFSNLDEILAQTLPGYSCANFQDAIGQPSDWHTYITPGVPSCLEPLDIRVAPSLVVLDDPQTDESARSLTQCATREAVLAGAVLGLGGPGKKISGIMPCTVIRPGDMADNILDRDKHPEWNGERTKMVYAFPTDEKLWQRYAEMRAESMRQGHGGDEATEFYRANREAMDEGAVVAWPERFNHDELSAVQHAMNLRLRDEAATRTVVLLDYETNGDVDDLSSPLSHAALVRCYLEGRWPALLPDS